MHTHIDLHDNLKWHEPTCHFEGGCMQESNSDELHLTSVVLEQVTDDITSAQLLHDDDDDGDDD